MSSTALYKAFIEVGASEDSATMAAEDVISVATTATGDKDRYCKSENRYSRAGNAANEMDSWHHRVPACRRGHRWRRHSHPNYVIPRGYPVNCK